jgi:formylglycine-generating enzyme required for sulfatase activity
MPVDDFQPNPWGLYQVHGNVWEWVEDCWHKNYNGAPSDGSAWKTRGQRGNHVVRGGSWTETPDDLRSARRYGFVTAYRYGNGFRVARTLSP